MSLRDNLSAEYIKRFAMENGADFIGIASPDRFDGAPKGHHPVDLLKEVRSIIVCGIVVPTGALLSSLTLYHKTVEIIYLQLDQIALKISREVEKNGGLAVQIATHTP